MRIVFMVMREHPYGREMLKSMLTAGFIPSCIIEEESPVASMEREKFLRRIEGENIPPTITELAGSVMPSHIVVDHNNLGCLNKVQEYQPDLIVLGGTRIIRGGLLDYKMLNVHPGLIPWVRGSSSEAWAIYHDLPVGVTCHLIDKGVDTGPILLRRRLNVPPGASYEKIVRLNITLAAKTMAEALHLVESGTLSFLPQNLKEGNTFSVMPPELLEKVKEKLAAGVYHPCTLSI